MAGASQTVLIDTITALAGSGITVIAACGLAGIARSSYYRVVRNYRHYRPVTDPIPQSRRTQPTALTEAECAEVYAVLTDEASADSSVVQAYWAAFDAGRIACSQRSFYRVAKRALLVGDRRRRKTGVMAAPRHKPIVAASAVGDLWSWDVTELPGPRRQDRYKLYLAIDVYSRYPVAARVEYSEDQHLAVDMFTAAIAKHGAPKVLHADNGSVMRSQLLIDTLTDRGALTSYSRPRVSDDNPFSESLFKTLKYDLDRPDHFDDIDHARQWTTQFLDRYAYHHRHSSLGRYTPHQIHAGSANETRRRRQQTLDTYYRHHPNRFRRPPTAPQLPGPTGINTHHLSQTG